MRSEHNRETSAGGVLIRRRSGRDEVCLILRARHGVQAWCLPKGHLEPGEDAAAAAQREVKEETGVTAQILAPLGTISYQFTTAGERTPVSKSVCFFLMRALDEAEGPRDAQEVIDARWMPLDDAMRTATYENERQVLHRAQQVWLQRAP